MTSNRITILDEIRIMEVAEGRFMAMANCHIKETAWRHWWWPFEPVVSFYEDWLYLDPHGMPLEHKIAKEMDRGMTFSTINWARQWVIMTKDNRVYPREVK